ncbi:MAG: hypothetical protein ABSB66_07675 [Candidatus Acidiferrales bacterium]
MAASPEYRTIFEIGFRSFPWPAFLNPSFCIMLGIAFYRFSARQFFKAFGFVAIIVGAIFFLLTSVSLIPMSIRLRNAYVNGHTTVIEGAVEDFHPMPALGPSKESFSVKGIAFSYYVADFIPCFTNAPPLKGPVHAGLTVRVFYDRSCIQRVDILK